MVSWDTIRQNILGSKMVQYLYHFTGWLRDHNFALDSIMVSSRKWTRAIGMGFYPRGVLHTYGIAGGGYAGYSM